MKNWGVLKATFRKRAFTRSGFYPALSSPPGGASKWYLGSFSVGSSSPFYGGKENTVCHKMMKGNFVK